MKNNKKHQLIVKHEFGSVFKKILCSSIFYFFIFILLNKNSFAIDNIVAKGKSVGYTKYAKVLIKKFDVCSFLVGVVDIKNDSFTNFLHSTFEPVFYRFNYVIPEREEYVDLIINGKEKVINFSLKANGENAVPNFIASKENILWYNYEAQTNEQLLKIDLLNQFIYFYPFSESSVSKVAIQEWEQEKILNLKNFNDYRAAMLGNWVYEMVDRIRIKKYYGSALILNKLIKA